MSYLAMNGVPLSLATYVDVTTDNFEHFGVKSKFIIAPNGSYYES